MAQMWEDLLLKDEVYAVVGAAMDVYKERREGFADAVYQGVLEMELGLRGVPFVAKMQAPLFHKGRPMIKWYEADLCCDGNLIVELKAEAGLTNAGQAQLLNFLKATNLQVGLLLNFGARGGLQRKRMVRTRTGVIYPEEDV